MRYLSFLGVLAGGAPTVLTVRLPPPALSPLARSLASVASRLSYRYPNILRRYRT